ncbi:MAG: hypothetical protein MJZ20_09525 [Bacteroidaceae bacterium]|nr:hypothetical protein [Bacteroidaceae bacterium]
MRQFYDRKIKYYDKWYALVPQYEGEHLSISLCEVYDGQDAFFVENPREFINDLDNALVYVYRLDLFLRIEKIIDKNQGKKVIFYRIGSNELRDLSAMTGVDDKDKVEEMVKKCECLPHNNCYTLADSVRNDIWDHVSKNKKNYDATKKSPYKTMANNQKCVKLFEEYYLGGMYAKQNGLTIATNCRYRDIKSAYGTVSMTRKLPANDFITLDEVDEYYLDTERFFSVFYINVRTPLETAYFALPDAYRKKRLMISNVDLEWIKQASTQGIEGDYELSGKMYVWKLEDNPQPEWRELLKDYWDKKNNAAKNSPERDFFKKRFNIACFGATVSKTVFLARQLPFVIGMYIVAMQRRRWMNIVTKLEDRFCYGDTDSIIYYYLDNTKESIFDEDYEEFVKDKSFGELGIWEIEHQLCDIKVLKTKVYLLCDKVDNYVEVKCAGCKPEFILEYLESTGEQWKDAFNEDMFVPFNGIFEYDSDCNRVRRGYKLHDSIDDEMPEEDEMMEILEELLRRT